MVHTTLIPSQAIVELARSEIIQSTFNNSTNRMGQKYLIDSNVLIDYMGDLLPAKGSDFVEKLFNTHFLISVVTKIEILGYNDLPRKMSAMSNFVSLSEIFH